MRHILGVGGGAQLIDHIAGGRRAGWILTTYRSHSWRQERWADFHNPPAFMRPATGHSLSSTSALACAFTHHLACNAIQGTFRFLLMPQPSPPRHKDPADDELGFWEKKKAVGAEGGQGETVPWAVFVENKVSREVGVNPSTSDTSCWNCQPCIILCLPPEQSVLGTGRAARHGW